MSFINNNRPRQNHLNKEEDSLDIKKIASIVIKNWYLFLISIALFTLLAFAYGYYAQPYWKVESKILVEDPKNNASSLGSSSGLGADFGSIFNVKSSADNEAQILKSRTLMDTTVRYLQLNVRIYKVDGIKAVEICREAPFSIKLDYKADTLKIKKYSVQFLKEGGFAIADTKGNYKATSKIGELINLDQYNLTLLQIPGHNLAGKYLVSIESIDATITSFEKNFNVALSDKQSTTIDLSLNYPNPEKGEIILNQLMRLYLVSSLQNKIMTADNTISFINERIALVGKELNDIEQNFQQYKVDNNIADISSQSKGLVTSASEYFDKLNQIQTQLKIFADLQRILNNPKNKTAIPSSIVAPTDVAFGQSISSYNSLLLERDKASLAYTNGNPIIENYDQQIETARQTLLKSVNSYKSSLETSRDEIKRQNGSVDSKLKTVPVKERGYLDFQRKQSLQQDLYLYLLQKKEETSISKTSTISSSRIIDRAKSEFLPYTPNKSIIYLVGLIIGFIIPSIYLFIKELLNVRINSSDDIVAGTSVSVIGEIGHNSAQQSLIAINNSRTVISEQFRNLRTKLNYLINQSHSNVILFTSSMGGEGKSFLSINLGSVLALTGKKVVFIELDLRKPKLSEIMGHDHNEYGFSNYAVSEFLDTNKLIKPIWFDENCSLISAGPIPPNPTELLTSNKLPLLIDELKKKFDYIIIDCAPVGLVTDALLVEKYVDLTFYVVREGYTYKDQLSIINDLKENNSINNLYVILNDVKSNHAGYSAYGYGIESKPTIKSKILKGINSLKK